MTDKIAYATHGVTILHEFLGDFVVYRNLEPADDRLPGLRALRPKAEWGEPYVPRKTEPEYARLLATILERARALDSGAKLERLLYIGDTLYNDGTAFRNLAAAKGWIGYAFIGRDDRSAPPEVKVEGDWYAANRWSLLLEFLEFVQKKGINLDESTVAVIDLDKTAIGARGRNDKVIDQARLEGVERTMAKLLLSRYDAEAFVEAYNALNQPAYHPFTDDNQDYLAYICLMLAAGLYTLPEVVEAVRTNKLRSFHEFIAAVHERQDEVATAGLLPIHLDVWANVERGDPTPFKAFRYNEYLTTAARFGDLPGATAEEALAKHIVITQEVREAALALRARGVLCFGVSDKPDEASLPRPEQISKGYKPLHRLPTLAVSEDSVPAWIDKNGEENCERGNRNRTAQYPDYSGR